MASPDNTFPELDRPPTYTSVPPSPCAHQTIENNHKPDPEISFESIACTAAHSYQIHNAHPGLNIMQGTRQLFYIGRHHSIDHPDLVMHGGYDKYGPQIGQASFQPSEKNFDIYLGGLRSPGKDDWDTVRCAEGARRLFHSEEDAFRFDVRDSKTGAKLRLFWMQTHDPKLGASKLSASDYKLVDEANDEVVAVYTERVMGLAITHKADLRICRQMSENVEAAAIMVVMVLVEQTRQKWGRMKRAMVSSYV